MKNYTVTVRTDSFGTILVQANSKKEARQKAQDEWDNGTPFEPSIDEYDNSMKMKIVDIRGEDEDDE